MAETGVPGGFFDVQAVASGPVRQRFSARQEQGGLPVTLEILDLSEVPQATQHRVQAALATVAGLGAHPNIVAIRQVLASPDGASTVVVTERCQASLGLQVRVGGCLPARRVVAIGIELAGALATCHRAGLVHGHLRPDCLGVTAAGQPALEELALGALTGGQRALSDTPPGVRSHDAPEVRAGGAGTPSSDVYGLAACLYELLTGASPWAAPQTGGLIDDAVPPLLGPGVPAGLSDLLLGALSAQVRQRPASAESLAHELQVLERARGWEVTPVLVFDPPVRARPGRLATWGPLGPTSQSQADQMDAAAAHLATEEATLVPEDPTTPAFGPAPGVLRCGRGHQVPRGEGPQRFCRYCGDPLLVPCGQDHRVPRGSRFCTDCGYRVT